MILNSKILGDSDESLIILHGLFGSLDNWYSIAKELSFSFQVHIIDQRNHGKSFHDNNHNYDLMSNDLYNYIQHHEIKDPIILGHSMGGKTAMAFSFHHPNSLKKLIIIDIAPKKYINNYHSLISNLIKINNANLNSRKQAQLNLEDQKIDNQTIQFLLKNLFWKDEKLQFRFNINAIENSIDELMNFNYLDNFWSGLCFFIRGSESNYILDSDKDIIKKYFLNSKLLTISKANHWVHFDQKEQFIVELKKILKTK